MNRSNIFFSVGLLAGVIFAAQAGAESLEDVFLVGKDATPPGPAFKKPDVGESYVDQVTGRTITRVSKAGGGRFNRNTYSRRQAENADGTMFFTYHGSAEYHVYDAATMKRIRRLTVEPEAELQWHPADPDLIRHTTGVNSYAGSLKLLETNVRTGKKREIVDLSNRLPWEKANPGFGYSGFLTDGAEGSPSADGNRYAWLVVDRDENLVGLVTYDLATDTILGTMDLDEQEEIDSVSMSPSGRYVIVSGDEVLAYDADLTNPRTVAETSEHSDIGIGRDQSDWYLHVDYESNDGDVFAINLDTMEKIVMFSLYDGDATASTHVSGKAFDKPGWAVISTYFPRSEEYRWTHDKVFLVSFDPARDEQVILNIAHTRNCAESYWTEPHAVPNRQLSRIYYNSNWGSCEFDAEVYRAEVPPVPELEETRR